MKKLYWVTGAAGGIGQRVVRRLLEHGHTVVATDYTAPDPSLWSNSARLISAAQDVTQTAHWERVLHDAVVPKGPLAAVIHLAAVQTAASIDILTEAQIDQQLDVNLKGAIKGARVVIAHFKAQGHGHLVLVGSMAGVVPIPGLSLYSASKFGLRGFALTMTHELVNHPVDVSLVAPSGVDTPLTDAQLHRDDGALIFSSDLLDPERVARDIVEKVLPKRPVEFLIAPGMQGFLARVAALFPALAAKIAPIMIRKGAASQRAIRDQQGPSS